MRKEISYFKVLCRLGLSCVLSVDIYVLPGQRVDDIDLYPAAIAESPVDSDALLGPTFSCLIGLQFHNLKVRFQIP